MLTNTQSSVHEQYMYVFVVDSVLCCPLSDEHMQPF